jgi:formylglycine-generating enzyme required for sulfatase activity
MMSTRLGCLILIVCGTLPVKAHGEDGSLREVETPIGVLHFIDGAKGQVQVGRRIEAIETLFRAWEPKRLNEGPDEIVELDSDFWLMKRKITNGQLVLFLNENPSHADQNLRPSFRLRINRDKDKTSTKDDDPG